MFWKYVALQLHFEMVLVNYPPNFFEHNEMIKE